MKIIVVGGSGTIGQAIVSELKKRHEVIVASHKHGDVQVDIEDLKSIERMYQMIGKVDAVISAIGKFHFGEMVKMTSDDYFVGINNKLMGQINLVLVGLHHINDNGSFTLISGTLSHDPVRYCSSASMVNAAIDGFVVGAAIEMPRSIRINAVSPTIVTESMVKYAEYFRGFEPVSSACVALAFSKSVEGAQTGQVYKVGYN